MTTEQAIHQADLMIEFMRADHEQDKATPGPYEQGSGMRWRETLEELKRASQI